MRHNMCRRADTCQGAIPCELRPNFYFPRASSASALAQVVRLRLGKGVAGATRAARFDGGRRDRRVDDYWLPGWGGGRGLQYPGG